MLFRLQSYEELVNGDYMKFLDSDNAYAEAFYSITIETPPSPTLLRFRSMLTKHMK